MALTKSERLKICTQRHNKTRMPVWEATSRKTDMKRKVREQEKRIRRKLELFRCLIIHEVISQILRRSRAWLVRSSFSTLQPIVLGVRSKGPRDLETPQAFLQSLADSRKLQSRLSCCLTSLYWNTKSALIIQASSRTFTLSIREHSLVLCA